MKYMIRRLFWLGGAWLPAFLLMGVIFISCLPANAFLVPMRWLLIFHSSRTIAYFGICFTLTFLFMFLRAIFHHKMHIKNDCKLAGLLSVLYGINDEFHQTFVPTRTGQPRG